jgi:hypothetical protein
VTTTSALFVEVGFLKTKLLLLYVYGSCLFQVLPHKHISTFLPTLFKAMAEVMSLSYNNTFLNDSFTRT